MNYISPSYESAMRHPIRATAYHGCNHNCDQGRTCPARQACELPDLPITLEESSPLANWRFWVGGAVSVLIWTLFCYGVYWVRSL